MTDGLKRWGSAAPEILRDEILAYQQRVSSQQVERVWTSIEQRLPRNTAPEGESLVPRLGVETSAKAMSYGARIASLVTTVVAAAGIALLFGRDEVRPAHDARVEMSAKREQLRRTKSNGAEHEPSVQAHEITEKIEVPGDSQMDDTSSLKVVPAEPFVPRASTRARAGAKPDDSSYVRGGEVALLMRARATIKSDPGRSLSVLQVHQRKFNKGVFVQERELLIIEALINLGKLSEAKQRAADFVQRFPDSAHRARIERLLAQ